MEEIILGIETSCDETSICILKASDTGQAILSNIISSQIDIHKKFGGVVPEVASRAHIDAIMPTLKEALRKAKIELNNITAIAFTSSPGLVGSLIVGISTAKMLSTLLRVPAYSINHLEGHIYANFLANKKINFPALVLIVSGGHTQLIKMVDHQRYDLLGETKDDAAGEAFDKVARILGLNYPGGPAIEKIAQQGDSSSYFFPRFDIEYKTIRNQEGFLEKVPPSLNFSFSGLKTAVLYEVKKKSKLSKKEKANIAAGFQEAVLDVLTKKTIWAAQRSEVKSILLSGGVSANLTLRRRLKIETKNNGFDFFAPPLDLTTDNAAMIASACYFKYLKNKKDLTN